MRDQILTNTTTRIAAMILIVATVAGCSQAKSWMSGSRQPASNEQIILGAPEADEYIFELYQLTSGDPATQAEIFADSKSASTLTPGPSTNLRYALVLATPGHAESNPQQATSLLRELLSRPEILTQVEISLATIHLDIAEELIVLTAETRQLRATTSRATQTGEAASNQRLATVEAENRRLRNELEEAEDKLDAITSIERSIRNQE
jgi:hypothetical protein